MSDWNLADAKAMLAEAGMELEVLSPEQLTLAQSACVSCQGFGYIGDGPFTCGTPCPYCNGTGGAA